jgi:hypothetical protein
MSRSPKEGQKHLATSRARGLLLGSVFVAALFHGMLASGINRTLVDMPAWQRVGAPTWAEFSRWADMGTAGLILYPLEGIGGAVPIDAAALLSLGGMLATTRAAPALLGTRHHSDSVALQ